MKQKKEIGLCLSGGGALGFAHIGALKALEEHQISPAQISGASIGAIIGVLYAEGYTAEEILKIVKEKKLFKLSHLLRFKNALLSDGFTDIEKVQNILLKLVPHNDFGKLKIPFHVCVVNLHRAEPEIISSGENLIHYVIASSSLPVIFEPKRIGKNTYVDGGIINNLPIEPLLHNNIKIIGIDVLFPEMKTVSPSKINIFFRSLRIIIRETQKEHIRKCDHYIPISGLEKYTMYDFNKIDVLYKLGYVSVCNYLKVNEI